MIRTALLLLLPFAVVSQDFEVDSCAVEITIDKNGSFLVREVYNLRFFSAKHGIYRDIVTRYDVKDSSGQVNQQDIQISQVRVPGHPYQVTGGFFQRFNQVKQVKIGDPDKTVTGSQHYEINYRVTNAWAYNESATLFYWNIKPADWHARFHTIRFRIQLPENLPLTPSDYVVYYGNQGDTLPSDQVALRYANGILSGQTVAGATSDSGQALTVLIRLPRNYIAPAGALTTLWQEWGWTACLGMVLLGYFWLWWRHGKDNRVVAVVTYYPPEGIDPALAGYLENDKGTMEVNDLMALIPYWGTQGIIKVEEVPRRNILSKSDTIIHRLGELPSTAAAYERTLFQGLFKGNSSAVRISTLKEKFHTTLATAIGQVKEAAAPFYLPVSSRLKVILYVVLVVFLLLGTAVALIYWGFWAAGATLVTAILLLCINYSMLKRNPQGDELLSALKGFRMFIRVAEEKRIKMLLDEDPSYFEKTMSYAMAFGLLERWGKKFEQLGAPPPGWYTSSTGIPFSSQHFTRSFGTTMSQVQRTLVSTPSSSSGSSGGGSSGGGFGGGGGGSW